jgi:hypothetical protein
VGQRRATEASSLPGDLQRLGDLCSHQNILSLTAIYVPSRTFCLSRRFMFPLEHSVPHGDLCSLQNILSLTAIYVPSRTFCPSRRFMFSPEHSVSHCDLCSLQNILSLTAIYVPCRTFCLSRRFMFPVEHSVTTLILYLSLSLSLSLQGLEGLNSVGHGVMLFVSAAQTRFDVNSLLC